MKDYKRLTLLLILFSVTLAFYAALSKADTTTPPIDLGKNGINKPLNLLLDCIQNGTYCVSGTVCNITVVYPNQTSMLLNVPMGTNFFPKYNKTLPNTAVLGVHTGIQVCCNGPLACGAQAFFYENTPTGSYQSTAQGINSFAIVIIMGVGAIAIGFLGYRFLDSEILWPAGVFALTLSLLLLVTLLYLGYEYNINNIGIPNNSKVIQGIFLSVMFVLGAGTLTSLAMTIIRLPEYIISLKAKEKDGWDENDY